MMVVLQAAPWLSLFFSKPVELFMVGPGQEMLNPALAKIRRFDTVAVMSSLFAMKG
jgi:hypothetical protein